MPALTRKGDVYVLRCEYADRWRAQQAGFQWGTHEKKGWSTKDPWIAAHFLNDANPETRTGLLPIVEKWREKVKASRAESSTATFPCPEGEAYLPYQVAGIEYALSNIKGSPSRGVLFADEMGLGKTVEALGTINSLPKLRRILVVCPASLKLNWRDEAEKWLIRETNICVVNASGKGSKIDWQQQDLLAIMNYELVKKHGADFGKWDLVIGDELHYCKGKGTQRSKAFYSVPCDMKIGVTGTPIQNRPKEVYPLLKWCDPDMWGDWWDFARRYCDAKRTRFGMDDKGAANLKELQAKMRATVMCRRLKKDVLKDLPPKFRQVIEVAPETAEARKLVDEEWRVYRLAEEQLSQLAEDVQMAKVSGSDSEYMEAVTALSEGQCAAWAEMAKVRKEVALSKVPLAQHHIENTLESSGPLVIFCHHQEVVEAIANALEVPFMHGGVKLKDRHKMVTEFQAGEHRAIVGSMGTMGVGLTLTKSCHVIFVEMDWVPAMLAQSEDRLHRISQVNNVLVQHLVLEGSLDAYMAKKVVEKQKIIDAALDKEDVLEIQSTAMSGTCAEVRREELSELAVKMTPETTLLAHAALKVISVYCDGAKAADMKGFSMLDVQVGRKLARERSLSPRQAALALKLAKRYRRQLPVSMQEALEEVI